jgi:hypothetical protein
MRQHSVRAFGALGTAGVITAATLVTPATAAAVDRGIRRPTLTVACGHVHHGNHYSAVRFAQRGRWVAGAHVKVTIARTDSAPARAVLRTETGPHGWFHLRQVLVADDGQSWVAGTSYSWTTEIYGKTWAMARRGSVKVTGSC